MALPRTVQRRRLLFLLISSHVRDPSGIEKGLERHKDLRGGRERSYYFRGARPDGISLLEGDHVARCKQKNAGRTLIRFPLHWSYSPRIVARALLSVNPSSFVYPVATVDMRQRKYRVGAFRYEIAAVLSKVVFSEARNRVVYPKARELVRSGLC